MLMSSSSLDPYRPLMHTISSTMPFPKNKWICKPFLNKSDKACAFKRVQGTAVGVDLMIVDRVVTLDVFRENHV
jgi:hypothetical protein